MYSIQPRLPKPSLSLISSEKPMLHSSKEAAPSPDDPVIALSQVHCKSQLCSVGGFDFLGNGD